MALSLVQASSGFASNVPSGTPGSVFGSNTTIGNAVVLYITTLTSGDTVSSVTGSMGSFSLLGSMTKDVTGTDLGENEIWVCTNVTNATEVVTVTTSDGASWYAGGMEWSGAAGGFTAGPIVSSTSSSTMSGTVTPGVGNAAVVWLDSDNVPSYVTSGFTLVAGGAGQYEIASGSGSLTASWTQSGGAYITLALIVNATSGGGGSPYAPPGYRPNQAVPRSAFYRRRPPKGWREDRSGLYLKAA